MTDRKVPAWNKPRMRVYEYNREFGGSYYQVAAIVQVVATTR